MPVARIKPTRSGFNAKAELPYELFADDFALAMQDIYDLLFDVNTALLKKGLPRIEETVRGAIFSGILSDTLAASLAGTPVCSRRICTTTGTPT